jgi:hypothetical protein
MQCLIVYPRLCTKCKWMYRITNMYGR